jgi:hypothetical protein
MKSISVSFENITPFGIWLFIKDKKYFLSYKDYPYFKDQIISSILGVQLLHGFHLYWPELDVDLELDNLENPEKYPLKDKTLIAGRSGIHIYLTKAGRMVIGLKTEQWYKLSKSERVLLEALYELGGSASNADLFKAYLKKMKSLPDAENRVRNEATQKISELSKEGFLKSNSPDRIWELSSKRVEVINRSI